MNCNIDNCVIIVNELGIYMQQIWQQNILVLCSSAVKEPVRVTILHWCWDQHKPASWISYMHFSVHTSVGKFVLTICNLCIHYYYVGLFIHCFIINSKLRLVSTNWNPSGRAIPVKSLQGIGPPLNPGLVCSWCRPWLVGVYWMPCGVAIPLKSLLGLSSSINVWHVIHRKHFLFLHLGL